MAEAERVKAGEEQHRICLRGYGDFRAPLERFRVNLAVLPKAKTGQASKSGNVLILFPDRLPELVNLNLARLHGELASGE